MISIRADFKEPYPEARHVLITVFAGPDADHRANVGTLHALWEEAEEICKRLNDERFPQTPEEARECVHGNLCWFGNECGTCMSCYDRHVWMTP